jgi:hypothetical protein
LEASLALNAPHRRGIGLDVHKLANLPTLLFAIINSVHRESVTDFQQNNFFVLQQGSSHAGFFFSGYSYTWR